MPARESSTALAEPFSATIFGTGKRPLLPRSLPEHAIWHGDVAQLLRTMPTSPVFDFVLTSPPYNLGKEYESKKSLAAYLEWQKDIITAIVLRTKVDGSICWQVGNYVANGEILPLDILLHPIFAGLGLHLRNRIVWQFGHGMHTKRRFSGRYEVVLWYTMSNSYVFNLDAVRVPPKYPGKRHYKGPKVGQFSSHPSGKNPEDVWDFPSDIWSIPNVKNNHVEKTRHPCQFPVGLAERLTLALTNKSALIFDPFCGVGSAGVAAALHGRRFLGAEANSQYVEIAGRRVTDALLGLAKYRPYDKPLYDHRNSKLSIPPKRGQT